MHDAGGTLETCEALSAQAVRRGARRIALLYASGGAAWILGSDWLLDHLVRDPVWWTRLAMAKGWLFIALSAAMIYLLARARATWARGRSATRRTDALGGLSLMRAIADGSTDAIFAKDLAGRYVLCNREAARVLGKPVDEIIGRDDTSLFPPAEAGVVMANDRAVADNGRVDTLEEVLSTSDGVLTYLATKGPLRGADGQVIGTFGISRNITLRKLAEDALREAHDLVQAVGDSILDQMAVLDTDGVILNVNAAWSRFSAANASATQPAPRSCIGTNYLDAIAPTCDPGSDGAAEAAAGILAVLRNAHEHFQLEYACPAPSGERWFKMSVTPLRSARGGAVVVHSDITPRRLAEQQLHKLSLVVEQSPLGIIIADTDGRIDYVNEAYAGLTGWRADEVLGCTHKDLSTLAMPLAGPQEVLRSLVAADAWSGARDQVRRDGTPYRVFVRAAPIRQAGGRITHHLAILEDITERDRTQAELAQHRNRLEQLVAERTRQLQGVNDELVEREHFIRTIADNQPCLLAYWDMDLRCRFANRAYQDWFGKTESEIVGIGYDDLMPAAHVGDNAARLNAVLGGAPQRFQRHIGNARGGSMHTMVSYIPDIVQGRQRGFLALALDVDEMKRAELELQGVNAALTQSRDHAEAANRAKTAFLANMSHEIRTPMNAIIGLAYLLRRDTHEPLALERLDKLSDAGNHLLQLIDDILDLSKIEAGHLALEAVDFSFAEVLARCHGLVAQRAEDKGLALRVVSREVPDDLHGDPTRLCQALLNLMSNAVKFTQAGGIAVDAEVLSRDARSVQLRLRVRDSGIGIAADHIGALFQAFVQADASTTRRFGGTGLGLAITQRLAELMGGEIGVSSDPGVGSEFWFTARFALAARPRVPPPALPHDAESELRQHAAGRHILVVEDNPVNQELSRALLEAVGLRVTTADSGLQALALAARVRFDAVLMDVQMPGMDGLDATRLIRALPGHADVPIIAVTASALGADRAACDLAGMSDHVAKPIEPRRLYAVLSRWLARRDVRAAPAQVADGPSVHELDQLERLLQAGDFGADAAYRFMRHAMQERFGPRLAEFETALLGFEHERALAVLRRLRSKP